MSTRIRISLASLASLAVLVANPASTLAAPKRATAHAHAFQFSARAFGARPGLLGDSTSPFGSGAALMGSAPVGNGPSFMAVDPAMHTLYVTNGFNENGDPDGGNTVSVIDTRHCQADDVSRCKGPWPTLTVGSDPNADPSGVAIDQQTDTVYVADANDNTVAVFNGATCNAETSAGCGQTPTMVPVPVGFPVAIFDDPANTTLYIPNGAADDVSMLNTAACNATDVAACPTTPVSTVATPSTPVAGAVDASTHTVYVTVCGDPDFGCSSGPNGVSVFDASTCNATRQLGCDQLGLLPTADSPVDPQVDPANQTLYTANGDNTLSAFDLHSCSAADLGGCTTVTPGTVTLPAPGFEVTLWVAVDTAHHSVYVADQKDDSVLVVNANICNGSNPAGCATRTPPEIHTGSDPEVLTLDPDTQTLYTANQVDNDVSVIDASRCNAHTISGCRARVPETLSPAAGNPNNALGALAADPAVDTTYAADGTDSVAMIDTSTCNAHRRAGCRATPPTATVGAYPSAVAVDPATHTVYVVDAGAGTTGSVTVFDDRDCNATDQSGCTAAQTLDVPGGNPDGIAVNPLTDTVYVATITNGGGPDLISVFNGSTCNATATGGCNQTPSTAPTGDDGAGAGGSTASVAVNPLTNTVYATSVTTGNPFVGDTVYVIDGDTCDAGDMAGCGNLPATVSVGSDPLFGDANPFAIAVDAHTDTIYTANIYNGEGPGTVSVIDGATCNSQSLNGCSQTPATAPAGFGTVGIAIDPTTNNVYATNIEDTSVTTIHGNSCNGTHGSGCQRTLTRPIVGDYPFAISVDPQVGTAYVADSEGVSVLALTP